MTEKITKFYDKICDICVFIGSLGLLVAIILTFVQVVLRYLFSTGIPWAEEFARYILIISMCLGISITSKLDRLPKVEIFYERLNPTVKYYLNFILYAVIFVLCTVLVWQGIIITISYIPVRAVTINMSMAVVYAFIPICGFLLMFSTLVKLLNNKKPAEIYDEYNSEGRVI